MSLSAEDAIEAEHQPSHDDAWECRACGGQMPCAARALVGDLRAARAENEKLRAAIEEPAVAQAMQCAWNDYTSDTGCYPDCFKVEIGPHGKKRLTADFEIAPFAAFVASWLAAAVGLEEER